MNTALFSTAFLSDVLDTLGGISLQALLIVLLIAVVAGYWVHIDARAHGVKHSRVFGAVIVVLFFFGPLPGIMGLAAYFVARAHLEGP